MDFTSSFCWASFSSEEKSRGRDVCWCKRNYKFQMGVLPEFQRSLIYMFIHGGMPVLGRAPLLGVLG